MNARSIRGPRTPLGLVAEVVCVIWFDCFVRLPLVEQSMTLCKNSENGRHGLPPPLRLPTVGNSLGRTQWHSMLIVQAEGGKY